MVFWHHQRAVIYLLFVINPLKVIGPVHRNFIAGPVTIVWPYIPSLIFNAEQLGAISQSKGWTLGSLIIFLRGSMSLTLWYISKYISNISLGRRYLHLKNWQLCLDYGLWLDPRCRVSVETKLTQHIDIFLYCYKQFFDWDTWGWFFYALNLVTSNHVHYQ